MVVRILLGIILLCSTMLANPYIGDSIPQPRSSIVVTSSVRIGTWCSGFIGGKGIVITAAHCIGNRTTIDVTFYNFEIRKFRVHTTNKADCYGRYCDVAILVGDTKDLPAPKLQPKDPGPEDHVSIVGHPLSSPGQIFGPGAIIRKDEFGDWHIALHVYPGDSGSPLFNAAGEVIGVIHSSKHPQNIPYSFAADIDLVIKLLKSLKK